MKFFSIKWPWRAKENKAEHWFNSDDKNWFYSQLEAMERGEEVVPPWIMYPQCELMELGPMWGGWRQADGEVWLKRIWFPFWKRLTIEEREAYIKKWPPPTETWELYLREKWK